MQTSSKFARADYFPPARLPEVKQGGPALGYLGEKAGAIRKGSAPQVAKKVKGKAQSGSSSSTDSPQRTYR